MTKKRKPFSWRNLTPAQRDLMERLAATDGVLAYGRLEYREMLALAELQKLGFADMRATGRKKLEAYLTSAGKELRTDAYATDQIIVRVTGPQIDFLRYLLHSPIEDGVGQPINGLPGTMIDICRRMMLRGWVEWYEGWNGQRWAKLTPPGREVLDAIDAMDEAIAEMAAARNSGRLQ